METHDVIADTIAARIPKDHGDIAVRLTGGREFTLRGDDPHLRGWSQALALQQEDHLPIYVEFAPGNVVKQLLICTPRTVQDVQPLPSRDVTVIFRRAPSFYTLKRARTSSGEMLTLMVQAKEKHEEVLVAVEPTTLEILYVMPVEHEKEKE